MSLESVRAFFSTNAPDLHIIELATSTATVALAAEAHGVEPGQIAKTLAFRVGERNVLLVARGEASLGVVYASDALAEPAVRVVATFPAGSHPPIVYPVAALAAAPAPARDFVRWLSSPAARAIFERRGFVVLD